MQITNKAQFFDYLMHAFYYELEEVPTAKGGVQKRLRDEELEKELKEITQKLIKVPGLIVQLKLGMCYNRLSIPRIQVSSFENRSGNKGRYIRNIVLKRNK